MAGADNPDFLDLPWDAPLAQWESPRLVDLVKGRSRHVVRMVDYDDRVYAIKETTRHAAEHEYRILRALEHSALPTVEPVGLVTGRRSGDGEELGACLITRYLDYALPYGYLFATEQPGYLRAHLLDAAVILLVRLHKHGVFWGDASFGNVLFRRDAGRLMAYLVDAETSEVHRTVSDPMREHDLEIARENVAGGLFDLIGSGALDDSIDPVEIVDEMGDKYQRLWSELTDEQKLPIDEQWRIRERVGRLNELGFDVDELRIEATDGGTCLWIQPMVVEEGHAHRRLIRLTGLSVQEGQARRLLNALYGYGAWLEQHDGVEIPDVIKAQRWLGERYYPVLRSIPERMRNKLEDAEIFHHWLVHRDAMCAGQQRDVPVDEVVVSFVERYLSTLNEEKRVRVDDTMVEITEGSGTIADPLA